MSRLDPLREGQDFLDAIEAQREHRVENPRPQRQLSENVVSREPSPETRNPSLPSRPRGSFRRLARSGL